ncbi:MAG: hypothetical protein H6912_01615 [Kordiimonadaceae bacterium]|nr:hypothetical protein [Kordiimonadaceae bacterium]
MKLLFHTAFILFINSIYNVVYADTTFRSTLKFYNGDDVSNWSHNIYLADNKLMISYGIFYDNIYNANEGSVTKLTKKNKVSLTLYRDHAERMQKNWVAKVKAQILAKVPEDKREQTETETLSKFSMIARSPRSGSTIEIRKTERTETIDGYKCTYFTAFKEGKKDKEYCVATWEYFPEYEKLSELAKEYSEFTHNVFKDYGPAKRDQIDILNDHIFRDIEEIGGYPILTRQFKDDKLEFEIILENTSTRPIDIEIFKTPSDFKVLDVYNVFN